MREMHNIVVGRDETDSQKFGERGTGVIGKHFVGEKKEAHLTNFVRMDFARPHIAGIFGKRGTGKCMVGDTLVLTENGFERIEDVFRLATNNMFEKKSSSNEVIHPCSGLDVASLDADGSIKFKNISHVYRKNVSEELTMIKTRLGREITCTQEHPLLVMSACGPVWKNAKDITEKDFVAIPRVLPQDRISNNFAGFEPDAYETYPTDLKSIQKFDILSGILEGPKNVAELMNSTEHTGGSVWRDVASLEQSGLLTLERNSPLKARITENGRLYVQAHSLEGYIKLSKKQGPIKIPAISSNLAEFIGYAIAEGTERSDNQRYLLGFTNHSARLMERYKSLAKSLFGITPSAYKPTYAVIHSKGLEQYLNKIGYATNKRSAEKDIPSFIVTRIEYAAPFLRAYADCEGHISPRGYIEISTASKAIAHKLSYLLLRFGIIANIKEKIKWATNTELKTKRKYYSVYIYGIAQLKDFERAIGFSDTKKRQALKNLNNVKSNPNIDVVPFVGSILKNARLSLGMLQGEIHKNGQVTGAYESGKSRPTPQKLKQFVKTFKKRLNNEKIALNNLKKLRTIKEFERLMAITHTPWKYILTKAGIKKSGKNILSNKKYLECKGKERIINILINRIEELLPTASEHIKALEHLSSMQVFWDKITCISKENKDCWVYDLTVPGTHNFIAGGGGLVCHNSFTMGVLAEEMALLEEDVRKNLSCIIVDAMGIFWSMKNPNDRDMSLFASWNTKPQRFAINLVIPRGQIRSFIENDIPFDAVFSLNPAELSAEDWALTFNIDLDSEMGILLQKALKRVKKRGDFSLEDIAVEVKNENGPDHIKDALINRLAIASDWGIFEQESVISKRGKIKISEEELLKRGLDYLRPQAKSDAEEKNPYLFSGSSELNKKQDYTSYSSLLDFVVAGKITVVDLSLLGDWSVRALVVGLLSKKVLEARMESRRIEEMRAVEGIVGTSKTPMTWIMIDEAHQFLPAKGTTPATAPLLQCVKIGREPGVSMVFVTQQPNKLHEAAISQCDLIIAHRLTAKQDIDSLRNIMQTYLKYDLQDYIDALPRLKGAAIILDDNSERIYAVRIRPRLSWHAGGSPNAIKDNVK